MQTPWGALETLREQRPRAGSRREGAKRQQRELFFAAMVACCEERGFAATGVTDLLKASGLSRGTFYAHFNDRFECYAETVKEIMRMGIELTELQMREGGSEPERARAALDAFTRVIVAQPAAARACMVDCYEAGEAGMAPMTATLDAVTAIVRHSLERLPGGVAMPQELAWAIVSGFFKVFYNRVASRRTDELPELVPVLWDWSLSYIGLPGPLRGAARKLNRNGVGRLPPFAALSTEQRIIRALAAVAVEKSYPATTVADVCAAASVSQTTFYRHFADKGELLTAALNSTSSQVLAAALPTARRAPDWPTAIRVAIEEIWNFLACEPELTLLAMSEAPAAGEEAIADREGVGMRAIAELLEPALAERPDLSPIKLEAAVGALVGVINKALQADGPSKLPRSAPLATFLVLAPLLGAERAYEVARSKPTESRAQ